MESYKIVFKPSVEKDFHRLPPKIAPGILRIISGLEINPFPPRRRKLIGTERLYRIRFRDYRIVYEVDSENREIIIHYVRHRKEAYRNR